MLREGWNFHGDIAIPMEMTARHYFGLNGNRGESIFDADAIESSHFVECMSIMLRAKSHYSWDNDNVEDFIAECKPYFGLSGHDIPNEVAQRLYDQFERIFNDL